MTTPARNSDGAIYSLSVDVPPAREPDWRSLAVYYHDLALRLQRSQEVAEREMVRPVSPWEPWEPELRLPGQLPVKEV